MTLETPQRDGNLVVECVPLDFPITSMMLIKIISDLEVIKISRAATTKTLFHHKHSRQIRYRHRHQQRMKVEN